MCVCVCVCVYVCVCVCVWLVLLSLCDQVYVEAYGATQIITAGTDGYGSKNKAKHKGSHHDVKLGHQLVDHLLCGQL